MRSKGLTRAAIRHVAFLCPLVAQPGDVYQQPEHPARLPVGNLDTELFPVQRLEFFDAPIGRNGVGGGVGHTVTLGNKPRAVQRCSPNSYLSISIPA